MSRSPLSDSGSWSRLTPLFDELVELPERARHARLAVVTAAEPDLAAALERLLAADAAPRDLLDSPLELAPLVGAEGDGETDAPSPERAGAWRILARLGRGGMAEVFAGERADGVFEQRVAVKVLRRGLDTDDLLARFARERTILARLEHPAIARLLDAGVLADGRPFLAMECVVGQPIDRYAAERSLPVEERLRLLLVACDAVAFAHRNLVVHRDLKPSNVLVTAAGEVKLLDFGIAKLLTPDDSPRTAPTVPELRALTPAYAAPEQRSGGATTTATDVWGLGVLAFELLVGEPPIATPGGLGDAHAVATAPPRPSARLLERLGRTPAARRSAARLAGDLDLVIGKALRLDPAERYSSAEAFADDLRRHLVGRPVRARPASLGYRCERFVRRHRGGVAAAGIVFAALAIGGGVAAWQARVAARERARPAPTVRYLSFSGHDSAPTVSPDGRVVAFRSLRDGRSRIWLADLATGDERPLTDGDDHHPRFSPDGAEVLFTRTARGASALVAQPRAGGEPERRFDDVLFGDYSPDGRTIVILRQEREGREPGTIVAVGPREGGPARVLARLAGRALLPPRWSPDGQWIAVTASSLGIGERPSVALVDAATGAFRQLPVEGSSPRGLVWTRRGALLYSRPDSVLGWVTGGSSRLVLHHPDTGDVRTVLTSPTTVSAIDIAGGSRVVYATGSFRVSLREIDLEAGAGAPSGRWLTRSDSSDRQPRYSPDGRSIVFSSNRGGNLDLWVTEIASGAVRRLTHDPALDWDPVFTPDGKLLWSTNRSGSFEIWHAEADGSNAVPISHDGYDAENPTITRDGSAIVFVSHHPGRRGILRMRADGSEVRQLVAGEIFLPELSPDGRLVAYLDLGGERPALRVASADDGRHLDFVVPLPPSDPGDDPDLGRCRWFPDGRSLAVLARTADRSYVVERHYLPDRGEARPRAPIRLAAETGHAAESFGISPDGRRIVVAFWDTTSNLMLAENVPGVAPP